LLLVAVRGADETLSSYELVDGENGALLEKIDPRDPIVEEFGTVQKPALLGEASDNLREYLAAHGFRSGRKSMVVVFTSPEILEGAIILGERSNGNPYNEV